MVGICDMPWMTGCQSGIPKFKLSWDYQDHGEKQVNAGCLLLIGYI